MPEPRIEVINTGSELLLGQVLNTHLGYFSGKLASLGIRIRRQATIPDGPAIGEALQEAWQRSDLILVTGGLGPTSDDVTRDEVAALLQKNLIFHPELVETILGYFQRRGLQAPDSVKVQALIPEGAEILPNHHGTAPGFWIEEGGRRLACLPGPPRELYPMFENEVMPRLRAWLPEARALRQRILRIIGLGESAVQERLEARLRAACPNLEIGYCARPGEVDVRLTSLEETEITCGCEMIRAEMGESLFGEENDSLEEVVIREGALRNKTVASAESCTGGLIAHRLTNVAGSSAVFLRGWVTYSNEAKTEELGVPAELIAAHGAVSEEVVRAMVLGALERSGADVAVATTGIAGPGGGTPEKPVGLIWMAWARRMVDGVEVEAVQRNLVRQREPFKLQASQLALDGLRRRLKGL